MQCCIREGKADSIPEMKMLARNAINYATARQAGEIRSSGSHSMLTTITEHFRLVPKNMQKIYVLR